jgi:hypothetical protein
MPVLRLNTLPRIDVFPTYWKARDLRLRGDKPGGVQINRFLHVHKVNEGKEDA